MEKITILGATGSIGLQSIDVACKEGFEVEGLSLNSKIDVLKEQLCKLPNLKYVAILNEEKANEFKKEYPNYFVFSGKDSNIDLLNAVKSQKIINSLVGFAGLKPSLTALKLNKTLCLANKESLVVGGILINNLLSQGFGKLYPIDSEHVALYKLLKHSNRKEVKRMIITASGGALRDYPLEELSKVTIKDVLNHPTWKMGKRITVDSTTMVNKGFEFIEASYLFNWDINNISVLINDESEIHSALEFKDNSYLFEVGPSDMRIPISYALNEAKRINMDYKAVDFNRKCSLNFREFNVKRYPLFKLVLDVFKLNPLNMVVLNAVDEELIKLLVNNELTYLDFLNLEEKIVKENLINKKEMNYEELEEIDSKLRELVKKYKRA